MTASDSATPAPSTAPGAPADQRPIRRALLSVFDKTGLVELATALHEAGAQIVSTGSTAERIREAGLPVTEVRDVTGFPEMLDGRVKTLHPAIHGGLLADLTNPSHEAALAELGIAPFDLVVSNLYPFEDTVAAGGSFEDIIEKIDIGGPAMVRSAAKNFSTCAVVVDANHYELAAHAAARGGFTRSERLALSSLAFSRIAEYDAAINIWMMEQAQDDLAALLGPADGWCAESAVGVFDPNNDDEEESGTPLRYGENAHQQALLLEDFEAEGTLADAVLHGGKPMSYNNYVDADAALRAAYDHAEPCVAVIKHNNPCGIAIASAGSDIAEAHAKAHATDPVSAFGGVIAANRPVSVMMAQQVTEIFTEVIVAPGYEDGALEILQSKKNLRILQIEGIPFEGEEREFRHIWGGILAQEIDRFQAEGDDPANWDLVTGEAADPALLADLAFAWRAVRAPKSNAILLAKNGAAVGIGMGQVNRVDSCHLAVNRANSLAADGSERARGSVVASDAFFPFADGVQVLLDAGVKAIVQPGGSVRDEEVINACREAGITMYFTGTRHFSH